MSSLTHGRKVLQPLLIDAAAAVRNLSPLSNSVLGDDSVYNDNMKLKEEKVRVCRLGFHLMAWERIMLKTKIVDGQPMLERKKLELAKAISYNDALEIMELFQNAKALYRRINNMSFWGMIPLQIIPRPDAAQERGVWV